MENLRVKPKTKQLLRTLHEKITALRLEADMVMSSYLEASEVEGAWRLSDDFEYFTKVTEEK